MAYSNFKNFKKTLKTFQLEEVNVNLFSNIKTVDPSKWLLQSLDLADVLPLTNEKSKSEVIITPILGEIAIAFRDKITLFSGEDLTVEGYPEFSGFCDFFFAKHPRKTAMQAPVVTFVEAKDEDFEHGQAQCTAQMVASTKYNELEGKPVPFVYGCAVTGDVWKFLKLEKQTLYLDTKSYYLVELPKILGIFHQIMNEILAV